MYEGQRVELEDDEEGDSGSDDDVETGVRDEEDEQGKGDEDEDEDDLEDDEDEGDDEAVLHRLRRQATRRHAARPRRRHGYDGEEQSSWKQLKLEADELPLVSHLTHKTM